MMFIQFLFSGIHLFFNALSILVECKSLLFRVEDKKLDKLDLNFLNFCKGRQGAFKKSKKTTFRKK